MLTHRPQDLEDLDGTEPATNVIRNAGIELVVTSVDISGSLPELLASVERLTDRVAGEQNHVRRIGKN